jgi:hypothetical protein
VFSSVFLFGGTGDVGRRVVDLLLAHSDYRITLVSRRGGSETDRIRHLSIDLAAGNVEEMINGSVAVVNLTEATPPALAATIVRSGGTFLDTSATPEYVTALENEIKAARGPGLGILCVGTAPGLSTLMAAEVASIQETSSIEVGIELGLGRHYGWAATEWFFEAIGTRFILAGSEGKFTEMPGKSSRRFGFGEDNRLRFAFGIGFPVQGISPLGQSLPVRSFLAVEPAIVTRIVMGLLRIGLGPVLARKAMPLTRTMLKLPALGETRTRISAEGLGKDGIPVGDVRLVAGDQAEVTAAMIVATLRAVETDGCHAIGATTISDHLTLDAALEELRSLLPSMQIVTWKSYKGVARRAQQSSKFGNRNGTTTSK